MGNLFKCTFAVTAMTRGDVPGARRGPRRAKDDGVGERAGCFVVNVSLGVLPTAFRCDDDCEHVVTEGVGVGRGVHRATEVGDFHRVADFGDASAKPRGEFDM